MADDELRRSALPSWQPLDLLMLTHAPCGLSNPPNIYHHVDDYPYRNSVLVVPDRFVCDGLPRPTVRASTLGQELGHMLLNTGGHVTERFNLMNDGAKLNPEQCAIMETNLVQLYGDAEVPDPGPPT